MPSPKTVNTAAAVADSMRWLVVAAIFVMPFATAPTASADLVGNPAGCYWTWWEGGENPQEHCGLRLRIREYPGQTCYTVDIDPPVAGTWSSDDVCLKSLAMFGATAATTCYPAGGGTYCWELTYGANQICPYLSADNAYVFYEHEGCVWGPIAAT